jgi:putative transposase
MANTYTQIYVQAVFAVQNRDCIINNSWEDELQKYITGIVQNQGHKMLAINGTHNHIHLFFGMKPNQSVSKLIQEVKSNSSKWINEKRFIKSKFSWQEGFGAFYYSHSQLDDVIAYVMNQKEHHKKQSFRDEYLVFLKKFNVEFEEKYLFNFFD